MPEPSIWLSIIDGDVGVTLNRSAKPNSFSAGMHPRPTREACLQSEAADSHDYRNGMTDFLGECQPVSQGR